MRSRCCEYFSSQQTHGGAQLTSSDTHCNAYMLSIVKRLVQQFLRLHCALRLTIAKHNVVLHRASSRERHIHIMGIHLFKIRRGEGDQVEKNQSFGQNRELAWFTKEQRM